jgi:hypothetical protein
MGMASARGCSNSPKPSQSGLMGERTVNSLQNVEDAEGRQIGGLGETGPRQQHRDGKHSLHSQGLVYTAPTFTRWAAKAAPGQRVEVGKDVTYCFTLFWR